MRYAILLACLPLATISCSGGDDGNAGDGGTGCSDDACRAVCAETYATELAESAISGIEAACQGSGVCSCTFYPCYEASCSSFCAKTYGIDAGVCDLLTCECLSGDAGS
ncbi:MAG: hypothetical protein PHU25_00930 [Deltaproteobacteria bacterium]|nr:hypothetical protein [Deltaproteobacteria bacterium]